MQKHLKPLELYIPDAQTAKTNLSFAFPMHEQLNLETLIADADGMTMQSEQHMRRNSSGCIAERIKTLTTTLFPTLRLALSRVPTATSVT